MDQLFSYTRKSIDRRSNEIIFYQDGERLLPYKLSSGEKQMLIILLTVLVRDNAHCVLFMDEPAVIMEGWLDAVTEVDEISTVIR